MRKYDARKNLVAFSVLLREETDLDALSNVLANAVGETMQPVHLSLWLRPSRRAVEDKGEKKRGISRVSLARRVVTLFVTIKRRLVCTMAVKEVR